ncbi:MAG: LysM peptidoglycan-binding domain-containing protein [Bacteroidales bacterium]|nr:LysM peptidoglycan-binding domain-containing protein [Bacteroidales bacterium]
MNILRFINTCIVIVALVALLALPFPGTAAKPNPYQDYIDNYSAMAVEQQQAHGIPASITLAQGLLESRAGQSSLATLGNNHFGIKCHREWTGDTLLRNDDAVNECFRSYPTAAESFEDHSRFLLRKRYAPCFEHDITDYASWANSLKACGYATDPNYATRLIAIIERYALYLFDTDAGRRAEEDVNFIHDMLRSTHPVRKSRGLHCVFATPGDTYSSIAKELGLKTSRLLELNDCKEDVEIKPWEEVYLEEKRDTPPDNLTKATIGEGESMHSIAQRFGMRLETLRKLNPKAKDRPGTALRLQ